MLSKRRRAPKEGAPDAKRKRHGEIMKTSPSASDLPCERNRMHPPLANNGSGPCRLPSGSPQHKHESRATWRSATSGNEIAYNPVAAHTDHIELVTEVRCARAHRAYSSYGARSRGQDVVATHSLANGRWTTNWTHKSACHGWWTRANTPNHSHVVFDCELCFAQRNTHKCEGRCAK